MTIGYNPTARLSPTLAAVVRVVGGLGGVPAVRDLDAAARASQTQTQNLMQSRRPVMTRGAAALHRLSDDSFLRARTHRAPVEIVQVRLAAGLRSGRIAASETAVPNMLANPV